MLRALVCFLCLPCCVQAFAQNAELIHRGEIVYQHQCATCHGPGLGQGGSPMLPGAQALAAKYKGAKPAFLDQRTDLSPGVVKYFVRNGVSVMPFFRKTMVSDADLDALAAYLSRNSAVPATSK